MASAAAAIKKQPPLFCKNEAIDDITRFYVAIYSIGLILILFCVIGTATLYLYQKTPGQIVATGVYNSMSWLMITIGGEKAADAQHGGGLPSMLALSTSAAAATFDQANRPPDGFLRGVIMPYLYYYATDAAAHQNSGGSSDDSSIVTPQSYWQQHHGGGNDVAAIFSVPVLESKQRFSETITFRAGEDNLIENADPQTPSPQEEISALLSGSLEIKKKTARSILILEVLYDIKTHIEPAIPFYLQVSIIINHSRQSAWSTRVVESSSSLRRRIPFPIELILSGEPLEKGDTLSIAARLDFESLKQPPPITIDFYSVYLSVFGFEDSGSGDFSENE